MSATTAAATAPRPPDAAGSSTQPADTYQLFRSLAPPDLLNQRQPSAKQAVYTAFITTWLFIHQRLHGGAPLNDAVSALLFTFPKDDLPTCKRITDDALSANNSAYSKARTRLDLDLAIWLADHVFHSLRAACRPAWKGRCVQLLDGSTFSLAPTANLREAYPPATNQYGPCHWPILRVLVAHDLDSGLVCRPEYGPMYGEDNECESSLAGNLLPRLPANSVILGDGNFGIFIVVYRARQAGHDILFRLSVTRFQALLRQAKPVGEGRWELTWQPSREERDKYGAELPEGACVHGCLVEQRVGAEGKEETLYLFATLAEGTNVEFGELYGRRWCVETDISAEKVTLGLGAVTGKTAAMVEKEVLLATVTYNLVVQVRRLAAEKANVEPRRLSFAGTLSLLKAFEAKVACGGLSAAELQKEFDKLLRAVGQRKVPNRPGRHFPRELIPRRRRYPERKRGSPDSSPTATSGAFPAR
jgi:hypothetical protein